MIKILDLQLFQLTGNANPPVLFDQAFFPAYNPIANGNDLGLVVMKYPRCYALDVDLGIIGVTYGVPASTPPTITPPCLHLPLSRFLPAVMVMRCRFLCPERCRSTINGRATR